MGKRMAATSLQTLRIEAYSAIRPFAVSQKKLVLIAIDGNVKYKINGLLFFSFYAFVRNVVVCRTKAS